MMTSVAGLTGGCLYLDTNILIHFVEGHATYAEVLRQLFVAIDDRAVSAVTSELTLAEALVKPLELGRDDVAAVYEKLISNASPIQVATVDRDVLIRSAAIRATDGGRLFDAIHVASAILHECQFFLTEDDRIRTPHSLPVLHLGELVSAP